MSKITLEQKETLFLEAWNLCDDMDSLNIMLKVMQTLGVKLACTNHRFSIKKNGIESSALLALEVDNALESILKQPGQLFLSPLGFGQQPATQQQPSSSTAAAEQQPSLSTSTEQQQKEEKQKDEMETQSSESINENDDQEEDMDSDEKSETNEDEEENADDDHLQQLHEQQILEVESQQEDEKDSEQESSEQENRQAPQPVLTTSQTILPAPAVSPLLMLPSAPTTQSLPSQHTSTTDIDASSIASSNKEQSSNRGQKRKKNLDINMSHEHSKPACVARFATIFSQNPAYKQKVTEKILGHAVSSLNKLNQPLEERQAVHIEFPSDIFPDPVIARRPLNHFNTLTGHLVRSSKEETLNRARSNRDLLEFGRSLSWLTSNQVYWLKQELKTEFRRSMKNTETVDLMFKAVPRAIYLGEYFGEAFLLCPRFFIKEILFGSHKQWGAIEAFLEKQRGKPHVFEDMKFDDAGTCNQVDKICIGSKQDVLDEEDYVQKRERRRLY
ncbi:unnamed protein product [Mucor circinelloides]